MIVNLDGTKYTYAEKPVDLVASGYEWVCPRCETFYTIIETALEVVCPTCKLLFDVGNIEHATP